MAEEIKRKTFKLSEYDETIRQVLAKDGRFRLYPRGTSMLPLLRQEIDSVVLVQPGREVKAGAIVFYLRDGGQYVLHRAIARKKASGGWQYTMCGDNQLKKEEGIRPDQIIGVVETVYRKDKPVTEKNIGYRFYVLLWKSFFIRRVFFKIRSLKNRIFDRKSK